MGKDILLVVDPQVGFISDLSIIDNILSIWDCFDMVLVSRFTSGNDLFEDLVGCGGLDDGEERLHQDISERVLEYCIFDKTGYSALSNEDLLQFFKVSEVDSVYVCGFEVDACVLGTVFSLFDLGISPFLVIDCCGSVNSNISDRAEVLIQRNFGSDSVVRTDDVRTSLK